MKFKTVREGEQAVIYNHMGEGRIVVGPERVFLYRERLSKLPHNSANQYEYLRVTDLHGLVKHIRGPCEMFANPLEVQLVQVKSAVKIDANHMIVIYKQMPQGKVERRILQGPTLFMPEAEEWLHEFKWHGTDPANKSRMIPGYKCFKQLAVVADQFYYNVRDVRTVDDTMLQVKLMIFYEMKDVIKMLETTPDPIADMINAVCADVIAFAGKLTFVEFLSKTTLLGSLEQYPHLKQRAEGVGFVINKVVYRGYHASDQLQSMQDSAIQSRTELRLEAEIQQQKQKLTDLKLHCEQQRTQLKQQMEQSKAHHRQHSEQLQQTHQLHLRQQLHHAELKCDEMITTATREAAHAQEKQKVTYLGQIQQMGVDLTSLLINQQPPQVDQELHVVSENKPLDTLI